MTLTSTVPQSGACLLQLAAHFFPLNSLCICLHTAEVIVDSLLSQRSSDLDDEEYEDPGPERKHKLIMLETLASIEAFSVDTPELIGLSNLEIGWAHDCSQLACSSIVVPTGDACQMLLLSFI